MSLSACCRSQFLKHCVSPRPLLLSRPLRPPPLVSVTITKSLSSPSTSRTSTSGSSSSILRSITSSFSLLRPLRRRLSSTPTPKAKNVPPPAAEDGGGPPPKLSLFQKFKIMYRDYWYILVPVHVVTSAGWLGGFYYLLHSGVDIGHYLKKVGFSESLVNKASSGAGYFAVAYAMYKVATPARYAVTLGGTTWAINFLRNRGYINPAREIIQKNRAKLESYAKSKSGGGGGGGGGGGQK